MVDQKTLETVHQGRIDNDKKQAAKGLSIKGKEVWLKQEGQEIRALFYPSKRKNAPVLVNLHGGGFIYGAPEYEDEYCHFMNQEMDINIFNVEYRLAPEFPYPAAIHDAYRAVMAIYQNADEFSLDRNRIFIGGDSAGASLATVVCYLLKEKSNIKIMAQILFYPCVDMVTPLEEKFYTEGVIPIERAKLYNQCYCSEEEAKTPLCSPILLGENELKECRVHC